MGYITNNPYPASMQRKVDRLFPFTSYQPSKLYRLDDEQLPNCFSYKNSRGYIHVLKPKRYKQEFEDITHYRIVDMLLTAQNKVREIHSFGHFESKATCVAELIKLAN
jgi:hypothetical protein